MTPAGGAIRLVMDLRRAGISDTKLLSAIERTPRELFAGVGAGEEAIWSDAALPVGDGALLPRPYDLALMLNALDLGDRQRVLQVPTHTGYEAALLGAFCRWVYTVDADRARRRQGDERLRGAGIRNVVSQAGDPMRGWPGQAPFDGILLTQGADEPPQALIEQLREGAALVGPIGSEARYRPIVRIRRTAAGEQVDVIARTSSF